MEVNPKLIHLILMEAKRIKNYGELKIIDRELYSSYCKIDSSGRL